MGREGIFGNCTLGPEIVFWKRTSNMLCGSIDGWPESFARIELKSPSMLKHKSVPDFSMVLFDDCRVLLRRSPMLKSQTPHV